MDLRVRFTEPRELVAELKVDVDHVERRIVRLTTIARPLANGVATRVHVHAGAIVAGRAVILERYIGELWGVPETDDRTQREAAQALRWLEDRLAELELDVRAGVLEAHNA